MDGKYYNLWSTDNARTDANDDVVIKSVYDPSPVGYSLPASNAFTGFTTTGWNVGTNTAPLTPEQKALCNTKSYYDKGWLFYGKPDKQGVIVFFPASGYRYHRYGSFSDETTAGFYWVAGPTGTHYGHYLNFFSSSVNPLDSSYRGYGFAVRSAEEKIKKYQSLTITV